MTLIVTAADLAAVYGPAYAVGVKVGKTAARQYGSEAVDSFLDKLRTFNGGKAVHVGDAIEYGPEPFPQSREFIVDPPREMTEHSG